MSTWAKRTHQEVETILRGPGSVFEMDETIINGLKLRTYVNLPPSIRDLWLSTLPHAAKDYLVYEDERYTYAETHLKILAVVYLLKSYGVKKGDRVVIAARNLPDWIIAFWATQLLGLVATAVNCWLPLVPMLHCITIVDPVVVILDEERAQFLKNSVEEIVKAGCKSILVFRSPVVPYGMKSFDREVARFEGQDLQVPDVEILPEDNATIYFTSGTTGLPKGCLGSNRNLLCNVLNTLSSSARMILRTGENLPEPDPSLPQKGILSATPLFHATALHSAVAVLTFIGGKVALLKKWDVNRAVDLIVKEKLTATGGLPFVGMQLLDSLLNEKEHCLESIAYGGGPVSKRLPSLLSERFPTVNIGQGFGATEVSSAAVLVAGRDYLDKPASTGLAVPTCDLKVVDENYNTLPIGAIGEICIKGANVTKGYWKNEKATKETFLEGGWYKTGDIGRLDEEQFLYILDRAKDIIIRGGENIDSSTIESAIYSDPRILDAAAVPVKDALYGEVVAVAVTTRAAFHGQVNEAELIERVASLLPKFCIPVLVDIRTEELTRNGVGKTDKTVLKVELNKLYRERKMKAKL